MLSAKDSLDVIQEVKNDGLTIKSSVYHFMVKTPGSKTRHHYDCVHAPVGAEELEMKTVNFLNSVNSFCEDCFLKINLFHEEAPDPHSMTVFVNNLVKLKAFKVETHDFKNDSFDVMLNKLKTLEEVNFLYDSYFESEGFFSLKKLSDFLGMKQKAFLKFRDNVYFKAVEAHDVTNHLRSYMGSAVKYFPNEETVGKKFVYELEALVEVEEHLHNAWGSLDATTLVNVNLGEKYIRSLPKLTKGWVVVPFHMISYGRMQGFFATLEQEEEAYYANSALIDDNIDDIRFAEAVAFALEIGPTYKTTARTSYLLRNNIENACDILNII